jgi:hypothetical protein
MKFHELMIDSYANYFCQKFFSFLNNEQRLTFLKEIQDHFVQIGNSKIGTYPLQSIIEQLKTNEEKNIIIESLKDKLLEMCQVFIL